MLKTSERIITSDDLAKQVQVALTNAQEEPLVVTDNGRPSAYLISIELFDAMAAQLDANEATELAKGVEIAEKQFTNGQFKTVEQATALAEAAWSK